MSQFELWSPYARVYNPLQAGSIDGTDTEPHDHAIIRAIKAHYKPNKLVVGDPKCTLFVARLNPNTTEETLKNFFSRYGEIVRCRLVLDVVTGFSKCYGFVEFKERYATAEAHRDGNKATLENHEIFVDYECERNMKGWVPRRLGGGFSGKKESGQLRFGGRDRPFRKPIILAKTQLLVKDDHRPEKSREDRRDGHRSSHSERHTGSKFVHGSERSHNRDHYHSNRNFHRERHSADHYRDSKGQYSDDSETEVKYHRFKKRDF